MEDIEREDKEREAKEAKEAAEGKKDGEAKANEPVTAAATSAKDQISKAMSMQKMTVKDKIDEVSVPKVPKTGQIAI